MRALVLAVVLSATPGLVEGADAAPVKAKVNAPPKAPVKPPAQEGALALALGAELERTLAADPTLHGLSVAVVSRAQPRLVKVARGRVAPGGKDALAGDDAFRVASVTKVFVAATVLRLHEQGRFSLFEPIAGKIDPAIASALERRGYDPRRITIHALLTHTSGLRDYAEAPAYQAAVFGNPAHVWKRLEQVEVAMKDGPPLADPGARYAYADTNYVILGDMIERATGRTLAAAVREKVGFTKLGLAHTYWERLEPAPAGARRAGQQIGAVDVAAIDASADLFGGGGLVSTTGDIALFFRALMRGEVFADKATLALGLMPPPVVSAAGTARSHAPLMRVARIGPTLCWEHGGFWGVEAIYCPDADAALVVSFNQAQPGPATLGGAGAPSLVDRLAAIAMK